MEEGVKLEYKYGMLIDDKIAKDIWRYPLFTTCFNKYFPKGLLLNREGLQLLADNAFDFFSDLNPHENVKIAAVQFYFGQMQKHILRRLNVFCEDIEAFHWEITPLSEQIKIFDTFLKTMSLRNSIPEKYLFSDEDIEKYAVEKFKRMM